MILDFNKNGIPSVNKPVKETKPSKKPDRKKVCRKAISMSDKEFINERLAEMRREKRSSSKYISRCKTSKKLKNYAPSKESTRHFSDERDERIKGLLEAFGQGKLVGYYKVNHLVGNVFRQQVVEVRDNGQIKVYDFKSGKPVTTFISHKQRIEIMMLKAGEIPDKRWLKVVSENRAEADRLNLN